MSGNLFVVSTPIGNLGDLTFRAVDILSNVDLIVAEDTRTTSNLLKKFKITNSMISLNIFNEKNKVEEIVKKIHCGKSIALVSDAGTPCISDPGYLLVNQTIKNGFDVLSVPGPSSPIAALSISGLPSERFIFEGFLPKKKGRKKKIESFNDIDCTIIFLESPHRLLKTLKDIESIIGNRVVSVCKELTKINEKVFTGNLKNIILDFEKINKIRGEYVVIIAKRNYEL